MSIGYFNYLLNNGYSKITEIFTKEEIEDLSEKCLNIFDDSKSIEWEVDQDQNPNEFVKSYNNSYKINTFFKTRTFEFFGLSKDIDKYIENLLQNKKINNIVENLLTAPKLHRCMLRFADSKSDYLGLHTDSDNTITMTLLLNDLTRKDATTVYVRSSHLFKKGIRNKVERLNPKIFLNFLTPSIGKKGDVNIFLNKTIHGVKQADKGYKSQNMVILLAFHSDENTAFRNLLLPEETNYGKKITNFEKDFLKFFEINKNYRGDRISKGNYGESPIDSIFKNKRISLNNTIFYYLLEIISISISLFKLLKKKIS